MRFFFYGTLLDPDVTALVLGRRLPPATFVAAVLPGYSRWRVLGGRYSHSVPVRMCEGPVAIVGGVGARDGARLAAYEGPGYRIAPLRVKVGEATPSVSVFEPIVSKLKPTNKPWDLALWQRRDKRAFVGRL